ncbi:MAG TPA: hypothetical protein VJS68_00415, partial [Thermoplasmata archaeon]|nr:hypothetical protein [Thermoplasmata archaeon]
MGNRLLRFALWALVVVALVSPLTALNAQAASPPNYTLYGQTYIVGNTSVVPGNISVDLISGATHAVYTALTSAGGAFSFTTSSTSGALAPGTWGLWIPPQAHVRSPNFGTTQFVVLPQSSLPVYGYENATMLTSAAYHRLVPSITVTGYTGTVKGTATWGGNPAGNASVRLLDPSFNGFVIANATTNGTTGAFSFGAPPGTWVLESRIPSGTLAAFNYTRVTVTTGTSTVNPVIQNYLTWGLIDSTSTGSPIRSASNVTLIDTTTGGVYASATNSPYYVVGTYPGGFVGPGAQSFEVVVSPIGYGTVHFPISVSPTNPSGGVTLPYNLNVPPTAPPAVYATTLQFSSTFQWLNVSTVATLGNDSTFPELPNATVGQLWAQLALDFQHNLTFVPSSSWPAALAWINSSGPFFPADQANAGINGTLFRPFQGATFTASTPTGLLGLSSSASETLNYAQSYNASGKVAGGGTGRSYSFGFTFRYPTSAQAFNYTVNLPSGYVLQADTPAPPHAQLIPSGPSGTWTSFTLAAKPSPQSFGTVNFTLVKYS